MDYNPIGSTASSEFDTASIVGLLLALIFLGVWISGFVVALQLPKGATIKLYGRAEWTRESAALLAIFAILFGPFGVFCISIPVIIGCSRFYADQKALNTKDQTENQKALNT
mmetsp:Transcript_3639/g.5449  ORF Transcript_3639/g.5449 Transcript_3639/m.5449 type:complete len:112 (+) Transcript_3639:7279-7614(+)